MVRQGQPVVRIEHDEMIIIPSTYFSIFDHSSSLTSQSITWKLLSGFCFTSANTEQASLLLDYGVKTILKIPVKVVVIYDLVNIIFRGN